MVLCCYTPTDFEKASAAARICVSIASCGSMLAIRATGPSVVSTATADSGGVAARAAPSCGLPADALSKQIRVGSLAAVSTRSAPCATFSRLVGKTAPMTGDRIAAAEPSASGCRFGGAGGVVPLALASCRCS
eukprot:scaffold280381_cov35-Tisochrysis_lutea.AAC.2